MADAGLILPKSYVKTPRSLIGRGFFGGRMTRIFGLLLAAAWMLGQSPQAIASMRVDPMIISLAPGGTQSSATVQITNVTDILLPVELTVMRRDLQDGKESIVPADEDFVMFPPQFTLKAGETQTVRLQWVGDPTLGQSKSYYVYATQIPVPLKEGESGVVVNYRFGISVHIEPRGARADLQVVKVQPGANAAGAKGFTLSVHNAGTRYARMSEYKFNLDSASGTTEFSRDQLKAVTGVGFLLPGESRDYFFPFEGSFGDNPTARLQQRAP